MIAWLNDQTVASVVHAAAWALLHFIWQGCVIACLFAVVAQLARKQSPSLRYILGCASLALMAIAPVITFAILWNNTAFAIPAATASATSASAAPPAGIVLPLIVATWSVGALICTTWLAGGWIETCAMRRLRTTALPARASAIVEQLAEIMHVRAGVRLVDSALVTVPMTIGWLSPIILLPASMLAGLSTAQLKAIMAHELTHVRRWDYLVNLLQRLLECILFYHPAVWWISSRVRQEREYCCDDVAAAVCGDRVTYAQALAELETLRAGAVQLALSSQGGSLMNRITRLLDIPTPGRSRPSRQFVAVAAIITLAGASAAFAIANRPHNQTTANETSEVEIETVEGYETVRGHSMLAWDNANQNMALNDHEMLLEVIPQLSIDGSDEGVWVLGVHPQLGEVGSLIHLNVVLQAMPTMDPIDRLIEAESLIYPWDIIDIMLGEEPHMHFGEYQGVLQHHVLLDVQPHVVEVHGALRHTVKFQPCNPDLAFGDMQANQEVTIQVVEIEDADAADKVHAEAVYELVDAPTEVEATDEDLHFGPDADPES